MTHELYSVWKEVPAFVAKTLAADDFDMEDGPDIE
jgi:hypothetical protein